MFKHNHLYSLSNSEIGLKAWGERDRMKRKYWDFIFFIGSICGVISLFIILPPYFFYPDLKFVEFPETLTIRKDNETTSFQITNKGLVRAHIENYNLKYTNDVERKSWILFPDSNYRLISGSEYIDTGKNIVGFTLELKNLSEIQLKEFILKVEIYYDSNRKIEREIKMIRE